MTRDVKFSRRTLMSGAAYGASAALVGGFPGMRAFAADKLVVGALYVGPKDDYGWNQSHSEGVRALKSMRGVTVNEEERVPETLEVQKSMESMIALDKASIIFATSYGYWDFMLKVAPKYPKAVLLHAGPEVWKDTMPKNVGSYNGYIDEAQYVAGIVAAGTSKTASSASLPRSPIPSRAQQHQRLHARRALGQSESDDASHLHRRLVAAGQGSRIRQHARGPGHRRHHLPRRQPEGGDRDGGKARHLELRLSHEPGAARAQGLPHRRRVELVDNLRRLCRLDQRQQGVAAYSAAAA